MRRYRKMKLKKGIKKGIIKVDRRNSGARDNAALLFGGARVAAVARPNRASFVTCHTDPTHTHKYYFCYKNYILFYVLNTKIFF